MPASLLNTTLPATPLNQVANDSGGSRTFCLFKQGPTASGWLTASGSYAFVPCSPPAQQTAGVTSAMDSAHPEL